MNNIFKLLPFLIFFAALHSCEQNASERLKSETLELKKSLSKVAAKEIYIIALSEKETDIDSLFFPGIKPISATNFNEIEFSFEALGAKRIEIIGFNTEENTSKKAFVNVEVVSKGAPKKLNFKIVETFPHNPDYYTQGLEYNDGILYESTGRNGKSKIISYTFPSLEIAQSTMLDIDYFGEGLTLVGDSVYQLTWQSRTCLIYNKDLEPKGKLPVPTQEGWGLCYNNQDLFISDGSSLLYQTDKSLRPIKQIPVYFGANKLSKLNELEFVNGKVWANVYYSEQIVCINPETGAVESFIDCSDLRKLLKSPNAEVLNGITFIPERNAFLVTGKLWDKMFLIEIEELN